MTIAAVWRSDGGRLWLASDSRISDAQTGKLIDEGIKLHEVSLICRGPDKGGDFTVPYSTSSIGLLGAGSSLIFQHVFGTLVPITGNLIGQPPWVPNVRAIAILAAAVTTKYVRSLGERRPNDAHRVALVVAGDLGAGAEAFELSATSELEGLLRFEPNELDLGDDRVHFIGDRLEDARARLAEVRKNAAHKIIVERAPFEVIRAMIEDPELKTIGGEVQLGFTLGPRFKRVFSGVPSDEPPKGFRLLNGIDLDDLEPVGPCAIGLYGSVVP